MVMGNGIDVALLTVTKVEARPGAGITTVVSDGVRGATELDDALWRHTPALLAAARALVRNESDARDLVQTTLEIATRKAGDLRDPTALRSWLLAIQTREAFRLRRRLARVIRPNPVISEIAAASGPNADVIAVRAALAQLPPRARAAVVLHSLPGSRSRRLRAQWA